MLIPNLSVLLAERRLTITQTARDTGISRTTLTALCCHGAKGVQFDTLNTLCQYLKVTPDALFIYRPFDLSLETEGLPGRSTVCFNVSRTGGESERFPLCCDAEFRFDSDRLRGLRVRLSLPENEDDRARRLVELLRGLPPSVLADLERELLAAFDAHIDPALVPDDYVPDLRWPWQSPF